MSARPGGLGGRFPRFLAGVVALNLGLVLAGWVPTERLAGSAATSALLVAVAISALASAIGGLPFLLARPGTEPHQVASAALAAIGLRLLVAMGLGLLAIFAGSWPIVPLVVWLGISYLATLLIDTTFALGALKGSRATE